MICPHCGKEIPDAPAAEVYTPPGRCPECNGVGKLNNGEYCFCAMGRDLKLVETRRSRPTADAVERLKAILHSGETGESGKES